jgi:hypothetical protein
MLQVVFNVYLDFTSNMDIASSVIGICQGALCVKVVTNVQNVGVDFWKLMSAFKVVVSVTKNLNTCSATKMDLVIVTTTIT